MTQLSTFERYRHQISTPIRMLPPYRTKKNQYIIPTGLENVAKLISKTPSINSFKYMSSYVRIENAIHPSITSGAIRIFFRNLQGLSRVPSAITEVPPKSNNLHNFCKKSKKVLNMSIIEYRKEGLKEKRFRHIPTRPKTFRHVSNRPDTFQTVSKRSNTSGNVPTRFEPSWHVSNRFETFPHVWKRSYTPRNVSTRLEPFWHVSNRFETFQLAWKRSDTSRTVLTRFQPFRNVSTRSNTSGNVPTRLKPSWHVSNRFETFQHDFSETCRVCKGCQVLLNSRISWKNSNESQTY